MNEIDVNRHYCLIENSIRYHIGIVDGYTPVGEDGVPVRDFVLDNFPSGYSLYEAVKDNDIYSYGEWYFDGWYSDSEYKDEVSSKEHDALVEDGEEADLYGRWVFMPKYKVVYRIYSVDSELPEYIKNFDKLIPGYSASGIDFAKKENKKAFEKMFTENDRFYSMGDSYEDVLNGSGFVSDFETIFVGDTYRINDHKGEFIFKEEDGEVYLDRDNFDYITVKKGDRTIRKYGTWDTVSNWKFYKESDNFSGRIDSDCLELFTVDFHRGDGNIEKRKYEYLVMNRFLMFSEYFSVKYVVDGDEKFGFPNIRSSSSRDVSSGESSLDAGALFNKPSLVRSVSFEEKNVRIIEDTKKYRIKKSLSSSDNYTMLGDVAVLGRWEFDGWKNGDDYVEGRVDISEEDLSDVLSNENGCYEKKYLLRGKWSFYPEFQVSYYVIGDFQYDFPDFGVDFTPKSTDRGYYPGERMAIKDISVLRNIINKRAVVFTDDGRMCVGIWKMDGWYYGNPEDEEVYKMIFQKDAGIKIDFEKIDNTDIMDVERLVITEVEGMKYLRFPVFAKLKFIPKKFYGLRSRPLTKS